MNCKPGDICIIVNGLDFGKQHIGKVIRVTKLHSGYWGCWEYEGEWLLSPSGFEIVAIEDYCLRPIRDPGDDAVDEVIERLGSPVTEEAAS